MACGNAVMVARAAALALLLASGDALRVPDPLSIRPVQPEEHLRFARFRAAAFSGTSKAGAARVMAVHKLVEERVAKGSTMIVALAPVDDAGADEDEEEVGWHPGLESTAPLQALTGALASMFGDDDATTVDQRLDDACRIVGVCDLSVHEFDLPTHTLSPDYGLYLTALAVHPAYRRAGIATELLAYADDLARSRRLGQLVLHVETDNDDAVAFYEAQKFRSARPDDQMRQFARALNLNPEIHALYTRPSTPG